MIELIDGRKEIRALEFNDAVGPMRQLIDLYAIWKRDIEKASALGKKLGRPDKRPRSNIGPIWPGSRS